MGLAFSAAATLMVLGGAWLLVQNQRLRSRLEQARQERATLERREQDLQRQIAELGKRSDDLLASLERSRGQQETANPQPSPLPQETRPQKTLPPRSRSETVSYALAAMLTRGGGEAQPLIVPRGVKFIKLRLALKGEASRGYRAALSAVTENEVIWSKDGLTARRTGSGTAVVVTLPVSRLAGVDYVLTLSRAADGGAA